MVLPDDVAVLYTDPRGPYPKIPGLDVWDEARDARLWWGPGPCVAHPPCGPWGRLRHLSRNDDPALALRAVLQVRTFGGVLEHPWGSKLWGACGLPKPGQAPDPWGGYTVDVAQVDWGHVRVPRSALVTPEPREPTHWISGGRGRAGKKANTTPVPPGIKVCSAQQRRRTPPHFALYLIHLARATLEG